MPLEARTWNCPRSPTIAWVSSVHTPVALTICLARISYSPPASTSCTRAPTTRSPSRRNPVTRARLATFAPYAAAVRTRVATIAGVVHLGVVVLQRPDQRVLLQAGGDAQGVTAAQMAVHGQAPAVPAGHRHGVVQRDARSGVQPLPALVLQAGTGTAPASPDAGRAAPAAGRAPSAPRARARSRASPDSAGRRGSACWTGWRCPTPSHAPRPGPWTGPGSRRRARCPRRPRPRPRPARPARARPLMRVTRRAAPVPVSLSSPLPPAIGRAAAPVGWPAHHPHAQILTGLPDFSHHGPQPVDNFHGQGTQSRTAGTAINPAYRSYLLLV